MQVGAWLAVSRQKLKQTNYEAISETSGLDLQVLLSHIIQQPRAWVVAHPEAIISEAQVKALSEALSHLSSGIPLPYIIGHHHFMNLEFNITPSVLIPRPETEKLVEIALHWLETNAGAHRVIDIGTGSGCIAASIAHNIPSLSIIALDISWHAIKVARRNFNNLLIANPVYPICANMLGSFQTRFDLICANLPYIPSDQLKKLAVYHHEPKLALDGGMDGLDPIRALLDDAPRCLSPHSLLLIEIESSLASQTTELASEAFPHANITLHNDLANLPRIIQIENHAY